MTNLETIMENAIAIPLDIASREIADDFASRAGQFAERVRRNTLAVLAVNRYLSWQKIETDITAGNSWHPGLRLVADVADLQLVGLGRLECRVVALGEKAIEIPLEVSEDRVAYMVLELSEQSLSGKLLGLFVPGRDPVNSIAISDLKDMDESIEYLSQLESVKNLVPVVVSVPTESIAGAVTDRVIEIRQWFNGTLDRVSESLNGVLLGKELKISQVLGGEQSLNDIVKNINERQRSNQPIDRGTDKPIEIPNSVAHAEYPVAEAYSLYILSWKLPNSSDQWAIFSVVVSKSTDDLPLGLSIDIHDESYNLVVKATISEQKDRELLYVAAIGDTYSEKIKVSVILSGEITIFSELFSIDPNS